jgi:salicylate hydroxylase
MATDAVLTRLALSGAFGSGAAFAFEDAFVLAQAVAESCQAGEDGLVTALETYDRMRGPHYKALYNILEGNASAAEEIRRAHANTEDVSEQIVQKALLGNHEWIYSYDVSFLSLYELSESDVSGH